MGLHSEKFDDMQEGYMVHFLVLQLHTYTSHLEVLTNTANISPDQLIRNEMSFQCSLRDHGSGLLLDPQIGTAVLFTNQVTIAAT